MNALRGGGTSEDASTFSKGEIALLMTKLKDLPKAFLTKLMDVVFAQVDDCLFGFDIFRAS